MITILHVTDLHAKKGNETNIKLRFDKLVDDLLREKSKPDILIFSGDIAHSGTEEEYGIAKATFLAPLQKRLQIPSRRCIFVPGNHDVQRSTIDEIDDAGTGIICCDPEKASQYVSSHMGPSTRLKNFHEFIAKDYELPNLLFYSRVINVKGVTIGIAALNSAWRANEKDKGKLHLSQFQVNTAADELENAVIKIAVVHHPFDWFHPSEGLAIADLQRRFPVVLTGHIHEPKSLNAITPAHKSLTITSKALFDGNDEFEGYNIYNIDVSNASLKANYRRFIRARAEYDKDTIHATNGEALFQLPASLASSSQQLVLAHQCSLATNRVEEELITELRLFQQSDQPIYVNPKIVYGRKSSQPGQGSPLQVEQKKLCEGGCLLIGASESGKSVLLKKLASEHNQMLGKSSAVYIDFGIGITVDNAAKLNQRIAESMGVNMTEIPRGLLLIGDHIERNSPLLPSILSKASITNECKLLLSAGNEFFKTALLASKEFSEFEIYEVSEWGPSRIREFLRESFRGKPINVDAAFEFVTTSLSATDLPASPVIVTLYASVFPKLGGKISSLSFVNLLQLVEQRRLETNEKDEIYGLYNKREGLILLARKLWKTGQSYISCDEFKLDVRTYFSSKYLEIDEDKFTQKLLQTKLIEEVDGKLCFVWYAFFDYYLAKAFERGSESIETSTQRLKDYLRIGEALSLYGGLVRNDEKLILRILTHVEGLFDGRKDATLADLDLHIKSRLLPKHEDNEVDLVATDNLDRIPDYEGRDPEFAESRKDYRESRESVATILPATVDKIDDINLKTDSLKVFYNIFRNLEHLDGPKKVELLDRILNLHIKCNFDLFDFYSKVRPDEEFRTFAAYVVTVTGQVFMANNVGNQTLARAILESVAATKNDFKRLLLICLYVDLRLEGYISMLADFVNSSSSASAIEILYLKITQLLVMEEKDVLPLALLNVFKRAFEKRNALFGHSEPLKGYTRVLDRIKAGRSVLLGERWRVKKVDETENIGSS